MLHLLFQVTHRICSHLARVFAVPAVYSATVVLAAVWGSSSASGAPYPSTPWTPPEAGGENTPQLSEPAPAFETLPPPDGSEDSHVEDDWFLSEDIAGNPSWYHTRHWFGPTPWDTGVELGINGTTGSNDSFSLRAGGYIKRKSRFSKLDFSLYHNRTSTAGLSTQDNATMDVRNDWLLDDKSPWSLFAKANVFYDRFAAFDLQTNANSGVGYQFIDRGGLDLTGRIGGGASREFGGPDNEWVAEALFGFDYEQKLFNTQKLFCKLEYYPEFEEFGRYRMVTDAGWEVELSHPSNVSLKLSATDRYDSTPNGSDPRLVNYSVLLLIKL